MLISLYGILSTKPQVHQVQKIGPTGTTLLIIDPLLLFPFFFIPEDRQLSISPALLWLQYN